MKVQHLERERLFELLMANNVNVSHASAPEEAHGLVVGPCPEPQNAVGRQARRKGRVHGHQTISVDARE